jgi:hypothetical protein
LSSWIQLFKITLYSWLSVCRLSSLTYPSVYVSVHETTQEPLDGLSWNLILENFTKYWAIQFSFRLDSFNKHLTWMHMYISEHILSVNYEIVIVKNIWTNCVEKRETNITHWLCFTLSLVLFEIINQVQHYEYISEILYSAVLSWFSGHELMYGNTRRSSRYSGTSIYRSWIIRFPGSVVQFLWSLNESYFNYGSRIYRFPGSIVSFSDPDANDE